jgi:hypothetical protein
MEKETIKMELNNALKMVAGHLVTDSDLSKSAKLQLLNFLESQASEHQVKALMMDGEIAINIDDQGQDIVDARFEIFLEDAPAIRKSISDYVGMTLENKKGK